MSTGSYKVKANPLFRKDDDPGYRVAWKDKYHFQKGHFDEEMTYGEAKKKAEELAAKEPNKTFWPELIMTM